MRAVEDETDEREIELTDVRAKIRDLTGKIGEAEAQIIWDQAVRELNQQQAWRKLGERIAGYREAAVEFLASRRLDSYELGEVQGRLAILRIVTQCEPLPDEQIDRIKQYVKQLNDQLEEQLEDERNLLRGRR